MGEQRGRPVQVSNDAADSESSIRRYVTRAAADWIVPAALSLVFVAVGLHNFLLGHTLAELSAIIVGVLMCAVAWQTDRFSRNDFLLFLACGYFWVGMIDLVHTLVYEGMGVIPVDSANPAAQFGLIARGAQALLLLAAPLFLTRALRSGVPVFIGFGLLAAGAYAAVMGGGFPDAYVEGVGPTAFIAGGEYAVAVLLALAFAHLHAKRRHLAPRVFRLMAASIGLTIAALLPFSFNVGVDAPVLIAGNLCKLLAFWAVFLAIVHMTLAEPYRLLEARVARRTGELTTEMERRAQAELAIRASEGRLRAFFDHSPDSITIKDLDGRLLLVNREFERRHGVRRDQVLGRTMKDLLAADVAALIAEKEAELVRTGREQHFEYEAAFGDGKRRWIRAVSFPVSDERGTMVAIGTVRADLTAQKQTEERLRHAEKLKALGDLAGGIAHELNNILQPVVSLSSVIAKRLPPEDRNRAAMEIILKAGMRGRDVVSQIMTFSRHSLRRRADVDIGEVLRAPLGVVRAAVPSSADLQVSIPTGIGVVSADADQMSTVLLNLVSNAVEALEGRIGRITISLSAVELDPDSGERPAELAAGRYARLTVADTGQGMDAETQARVFDPFFTTRDVGAGMGLGLSIVHGIVAAHGGAVTVTSAPGEGATFDVYLPLKPGVPTEAVPAA